MHSEALLRLPLDRQLAVVTGDLARRSLKEFSMQAWEVHHRGKKLQWGWYLDAICEHLEAVSKGWIRKLHINIPPRFLKSFLVSVYWPSWWWTKESSKQFFCVSGVEKVVLRDAETMRELVRSKWYQSTFRPDWSLETGQDAKTYYKTTAGGHRISQTTRQLTTGLGGDVTIIDDPHDAQAVERSPIRLEHDRIFLDKVLSTRKNDQNDPTVLIMQRLHERDYSGHILAHKTGWVHLCIPNEFDGERRRSFVVVGGVEHLLSEDPRTKEGELLNEERVNAERTEELKEDLGPTTYQAQFQQKPTKPGGAIFREKWFQWWIPGHLPEFDYLCGSWDFAFKDTKDSDYVVGQTWGVKGALCYLLAQKRDRLSFTQCIDAMLAQQEEAVSEFGQAIRWVVVEEKANGPKIKEELEETIPGLLGYNPQGETKSSRAWACQPWFKAAQIYLPHQDDFKWVRDELVPELLHFRPNCAHDDQVDALTQALLQIHGWQDLEVVSLGSV